MKNVKYLAPTTSVFTALEMNNVICGTVNSGDISKTPTGTNELTQTTKVGARLYL